MRALFFNEGNLGGYILGQGQLDAALRAGLSTAPDIEARFLGLAPLSRFERALATRPLPLLAGLSLDFRTLRWHLVQALRARAQLDRELRRWPADVVHVHSHSIALTMGAVMRRLPVVLSLDATVHGWWSMPGWPLSQRYASITIAPSMALERRALGAAALVLAWTGWARRDVEREAPRAQVIEHHPGLDLQHYRPAARRERERPRVLFIGGRFADKGGPDLVAALGDGLGQESSSWTSSRRTRWRSVRACASTGWRPRTRSCWICNSRRTCCACRRTRTRTRGRCSRRWPVQRPWSRRASARSPSCSTTGARACSSSTATSACWARRCVHCSPTRNSGAARRPGAGAL